MKRTKDPNIFEENKKSQFMNLSQFDQSDAGEWDQQLDEEERKEILLARSELQQAENTPFYRQQS